MPDKHIACCETFAEEAYETLYPCLRVISDGQWAGEWAVSVGDGELLLWPIYYCPFCGAQLPRKPFRYGGLS